MLSFVNVRNDMKKEVMSSKERPAYLKAEEKTEVASIKEEIQEEQTVKPEESDTVDTEVSSKEETSNATYTEKETIENAFATLNIPIGVRGETLTPQQFVELSNLLF